MKLFLVCLLSCVVVSSSAYAGTATKKSIAGFDLSKQKPIASSPFEVSPSEATATLSGSTPAAVIAATRVRLYALRVDGKSITSLAGIAVTFTLVSPSGTRITLVPDARLTGEDLLLSPAPNPPAAFAAGAWSLSVSATGPSGFGVHVDKGIVKFAGTTMEGTDI